MRIHELKILPHHFHSIVMRTKTFEVRKNDRDYRVGDELLLKEYVPKGYQAKTCIISESFYTGHQYRVLVTYILPGGSYGIDKDCIVMAVVSLECPKNAVITEKSTETI